MALLTEDRRGQIEELFRRHGKGVGSYLLARLGDRDLAEQLTGAVFLIVVSRFEQCRGSQAAWLWSIVRSELARHFRDRKITRPLDAATAETVDGSPSPSRRAERREDEARVHAAMSRLTDEQQALVYMKFFLDLPNVEIAAALGTTPNNVGVASHRAIKRLRALMEPDADGAAKDASARESSISLA